jgi:hypothetical protein
VKNLARFFLSEGMGVNRIVNGEAYEAKSLESLTVLLENILQ